MPAALGQFLDVRTVAQMPARRSAVIFASAGILLGVAGWSFAHGAHASNDSSVAPLYPSSAPAIQLIDVPALTVLQVVHKLPITSRYDILLANSGVRDALASQGPYTLFAPADNYFDYLPKGAYVGLTRPQQQELAEYSAVSAAAVEPDASASGQYITLAHSEVPVSVQDGAVHVGDGFAIRGYRAKNGIVYVVDKVLAPSDLAGALGGK